MTAELQHTLAKSAGFSGTSLHTGEKVTLKLQSAPVDHGIKFKRKDLADEPTIDANIANLKTVERATTIGEGAVRVHTVEHVLSALSAMGVDNAIIEMDAKEPPIGGGVLSKEPLRFADEFARHKILDIIGDIALIGTRIRGHIIAVKPGHAANAELARAIVKQHAKITALSVPRTFPPGEGGLDINQVMEILPHRFPFLMVDRILGFEGETKCTGMKTVTVNEPYFAGHFPGHPVMPGVLQVEAMAQVASILLMKLAKSASRIGYFMSADEVKFHKPVFHSY